MRYSSSDTISLTHGSPYTPIWRRAIAYQIDWFVIFLISGIVSFLLGFAIIASHATLFEAVLGIVYVTYFTLCNSVLFSGQSLGKRVEKICVVDKQNNYLTIKKSFLRALVFGVWILLATTGLLSDLAMRLVDLSGLSVSLITIYLVVFNKPTKRTLHDFIVGSIVIKTDYKNCDLSDDFEMVWDKHKYKILLVCVLTLIIYIAFPQ